MNTNKSIKNILITGAGGYIGCHVVDSAIHKQYHVSCSDINFSTKFNDVTYYKKDILSDSLNPDLYTNLGSPDIIIHLAWQNGFNHSAVSHLEQLPKHFNFLKNMIDSGCKSISVIGSMHEVGYFEGEVDSNTPCNPLSLYGIAKNTLRQALTIYCAPKNVSLKWLRAFYVTGDDYNNKSIFSKILRMAEDGQKTFPFTSGINKYDFLDIDTLSDYILTASVQNKISGIINVCSGKPVALKDKVDEFIKLNKLDIKPEYGAFKEREYDSPAIWGNTDLINKIMND